MSAPARSLPRQGVASPPRFHNPCDALAPLYERGITPETIHYFDIRAVQCKRRGASFVGALYPVRKGWRVKALWSGAPEKCWWDAHSPDAPRYLYDGGPIAAGEPLLLVEGEPDRWLMHSLGIPARTTLRGAETTPSFEVIDHLIAAAPSVVLTAYDNDDAGRRGAVKAVRALRDAGLIADALALPAWLPDKGDLTDLYAALCYDRAAFIEALRGLDRLPIPAPEPSPEPRSYERHSDGPTPREAYNAANDIIAVAERRGDVHRVGRSSVTLCPFHADTSASLYLYPDDGHFHCFACGAHGDAYDLDQGRCRRDGREVRVA